MAIYMPDRRENMPLKNLGFYVFPTLLCEGYVVDDSQTASACGCLAERGEPDQQGPPRSDWARERG